MPKNNKKTNNEKFAQDVLTEVNRLKQIAEQNVQANLAEMFSPSVKKMIAEAVMGEEDEYDEPSEEDLEDLEDALEEADYSDELEDDDDDSESMEEGEDSEEDFEDLEDLEEGEEADEMPDDEDDDEDFEELDEEFIRELEAILEGGDEEEDDMDMEDLDEMDKGELDEDQTGHSYSEKDPKPKMDEDQTGHSYSEKDPKPKMDADPHTDSYIKENRELKRMMRKVMRTLNEVTLDNDKTEELKNIFENYNVPEKAKVRVLSAIDKAKTKSEMFAISEAVKKQYKRKDSKRRVNESAVRGSKKIGGNSKIKKIKKGTKGKNLKESINYDFANRLAEIANIG